MKYLNLIFLKKKNFKIVFKIWVYELNNNKNIQLKWNLKFLENIKIRCNPKIGFSKY